MRLHAYRSATASGEATIIFIFRTGSGSNQAVIRGKNRVDAVMLFNLRLSAREAMHYQLPNFSKYAGWLLNLYSTSESMDWNVSYINYGQAITWSPEDQPGSKVSARSQILGSRTYAMRSLVESRPQMRAIQHFCRRSDGCVGEIKYWSGSSGERTKFWIAAQSLGNCTNLK